MKARRLGSVMLALALFAPWTGAAWAHGHGHGQQQGNASSKPTAATALGPSGASTATFQDSTGTGKAAFRNRGACVSFFSHDRSATNVTITPSTKFSPQTALPSQTTALVTHGSSLAARSVCLTTHSFTVAFTNDALTVNNQAVSLTGQTITVKQLTQSPLTVLSGTHAFANHGACVSFFSRNKHLFVLTLK